MKGCNKKNTVSRYLSIACATILTACNSQNVPQQNKEPISFKPIVGTNTFKPANNQTGTVSSTVYIYKMKKDYSKQVPVLMDESRSRIVSYPSPSDLLRNGKPTLPTPLEKGFWLDNRGIGPTVAFLSYTYEEYIALPKAPSYQDLMSHIVDKYPLTVILVCGQRADYNDIVAELNEKIRKEGWK